MNQGDAITVRLKRSCQVIARAVVAYDYLSGLKRLREHRLDGFADRLRGGRSGSDAGKWIKGVRYSLLKDPSKQTTGQLLKLAEVQQTNKAMFRAALLNGELRYVYKVPKEHAEERVARVGVALPPETVRQARAHDPQTQSRRTRRARARDQQRVPFILHLLVSLWS